MNTRMATQNVNSSPQPSLCYAELIGVVTLIAAALACACAPVQKYHPAPIVPAETAARLESRKLSEPGLRRFMETNLRRQIEPWPPSTWDVEKLIWAAYYFNPQMEIARAQAATAQAAVITAGERPNPTLSVVPGIPSPYLLDLDLALPVQTAGRRGLKVERAKALTDAARLNVAATAWKVRSGVRSAALAYFLALRQASLLESEVSLYSERLQGLSARLAAGEAARPDVDAAQLDLMNARIARRSAQGRAGEARAALAAALGVPVSTFVGIKFDWASLDRLPSVVELSPQTIQRDAVLDRLDVRQSLAVYAAADSALRLELARQHPNLQIAPGYHYEEKDNFFTLGLAVTLPVFNRNQGPIAEAESRRQEAAARFLATQAAAIAQSEEALVQYRSALAELREARAALNQNRKVREPAAREAVKSGESDRLFLNSVKLQGAAAVATQLAALGHAQTALGRLEDAVERPLEPGEIPPPALDSSTPGKEHP